MKRLVLLKQHNCVQLGHLYEHLFINEVKSLFFKHKLYKNVDFQASGVTFDDCGVITIDVELYNDQAENLLAEIPQITPDFSELNIDLALAQILAEEEFMICITDKKAVISELENLAQTKWRNIDDDNTDFVHDAEINDPIYLVDEPIDDMSTVDVSLKISSGHDTPRGRALLMALARPLLHTAADVVSQRLGYYFSKYEPDFETGEIYTQLDVAPQAHLRPDVASILQQVRAIVRDMLNPDFKARFLSRCQTFNYSQPDLFSPDLESAHDFTRVHIGSVGWKALATNENLDNLINNLEIIVRYAGQQESAKLGR